MHFFSRFTWRLWTGIGLLIAMVGLGEATEWHHVTHGNQEVWWHLLRARRDGINPTVAALTSLFNPLNATILVVVCGLGVWALTRNIRQAAYVWGTVIFATIISTVTKALADVARPPLAGRLVQVSSASFPSGHTTAVTALGVALATVFAAYLRASGRGRRAVIAVWVFAWVWVAVIALTRLYLGVHWMTDVMGGMLVGAAAALIAADFAQVSRDVLPRFHSRRQHGSRVR